MTDRTLYDPTQLPTAAKDAAQQLAAPTNTYTIVVVIRMTTDDDAPKVYADACAVVEGFMRVTKAEYKSDNGVAVFHGVPSKPLSECTASLYTSDATRTRVGSIDYREQGAGIMSQMVHPQGKR